MTKLSTKIGSNSFRVWMKNALGVFMLGSLMVGQPVSANQDVNDLFTSTDSVQTEAASEVAVEVAPPSVQEVLLSVCEANGYGTECAKTLFGMLWTESSNRSTVIGDGGKARGYFQIHYKLHKIPVSCAEDLVCSANWSLDYLESNHYPKYVNYAVQCHNSCGVKNGYAAKVARNAKLLWNKPMVVTQASPVELAMK